MFITSIDTKDRVVTLENSVTTQAMRNRSAMIGFSFNGIRSVDNRSTIKGEWVILKTSSFAELSICIR